MSRDLPGILLQHLKTLEPEAQFSVTLPLVQSSSGKKYFAKVGTPDEKDQYIGEAESLNAMSIAAPGLSPRVLAYGETEGRPYFLSEYKDIGRLSHTAAETLGKRLAEELHKYRSTKGFGFDVPTYCGATRQENGWFKTWAECFDALMGGLLTKLGRGLGDLRAKGEEVRRE
jgi:protein-ribulosamine 3-kinase